MNNKRGSKTNKRGHHDTHGYERLPLPMYATIIVGDFELENSCRSALLLPRVSLIPVFVVAGTGVASLH